MNDLNTQADKLEEVTIRLDLLNEVATPYTLDISKLRDSDRRYFMETVLPKIMDAIDFVNNDIKNVIDQLGNGGVN